MAQFGSNTITIFIILLSLAFQVSHCAYQCTVDEDCNLNGVCLESMCLCDVGWKGDDCAVLDLLPAMYNTGYNRTAEGISSWGGKIIQDPSNSTLYHLFAAEFTHGCTLTFWSPYSRIIHATSTSPAGPYTFQNQVVGTFAHNPTVVYSEFYQSWLMFHIGCNFTVPSTCQQTFIQCDPGNNNNGESGITMRVAKTLDGEWQSMGIVLGADTKGTWDCDTTNPSPYPLANGSVVLAYRGCPYNCNGAELINIAFSSNSQGPYTRLHANPIFPNANEDPFIWQDTRGNWHLLLHSLEANGGFGGPNVGRHAFARSFSGNWTFWNRTLTYNTTVEFSDGSAVDFNRRERPQLFFDSKGQMTYLVNGVQQQGTDASYTLIQPIRT